MNVLEAKSIELQNWKDHKVYEEVENEGQSTISVRWVVTKKKKADGNVIFIARLVARGFEELEKNEFRKDSPTCCKENFRLILAVVSNNGWKISSLDIKSAFLQGQAINRDVFLKPPKEAGTKKLWKLWITIYGLCDAPRAWCYYSIFISHIHNIDSLVYRY